MVANAKISPMVKLGVLAEERKKERNITLASITPEINNGRINVKKYCMSESKEVNAHCPTKTQTLMCAQNHPHT